MNPMMIALLHLEQWTANRRQRRAARWVPAALLPPLVRRAVNRRRRLVITATALTAVYLGSALLGLPHTVAALIETIAQLLVCAALHAHGYIHRYRDEQTHLPTAGPG